MYSLLFSRFLAICLVMSVVFLSACKGKNRSDLDAISELEERINELSKKGSVGGNIDDIGVDDIGKLQRQIAALKQSVSTKNK